jgi:hypothetical protein
MPSSDNGLLNVNIFHDLCQGNWNITGTTTTIKVYDLTVADVDASIISTYDNATQRNAWTTSFTGTLTFEEFSAFGKSLSFLIYSNY